MPKLNRKSNRLKEYDYSQPGAYFVTICVQGHRCVLGEVIDGEMKLNDIGMVAAVGWKWLGEKFRAVNVDIFCVMPNHVHAIISIIEPNKTISNGRGGLQTAPTQANLQNQKPLGRLVDAYKTHTTVKINKLSSTPGEKFWQRNYYEHIIRDKKDFESIYKYIEGNPQRWKEDNYYS